MKRLKNADRVKDVDMPSGSGMDTGPSNEVTAGLSSNEDIIAIATDYPESLPDQNEKGSKGMAHLFSKRFRWMLSTCFV